MKEIEILASKIQEAFGPDFIIRPYEGDVYPSEGLVTAKVEIGVELLLDVEGRDMEYIESQEPRLRTHIAEQFFDMIERFTNRKEEKR